MKRKKGRGRPERLLDIEAGGKNSPDYHLEIRLTNRSRKALITYRYSLPWVGRHSMILIAAKTDAVGSTLVVNSPIDDPGPDTVTIKPGETLTGNISMVDRFTGFLEALSERDIVVFWSYAFQPLDVPPLARTGGYVLFRGTAGEMD